MTPELLSRLDALAAKLGVAAEYLWPRLVAFSWWEALGQLCVCAALALGGLAFTAVSVRFGRKELKYEADHGGEECGVYCGVTIASGIVAALLLMITLISLATIGPPAVATLASPEAAALKEILR